MNLQAKLAKLEEAKAAVKAASPARERITALFDEGSFTELDAYVDCGAGVGVITGYGSIDGSIVYAFSQDVKSCGGAVSRAHAEKIAKVYELAVKNGAPVVGIYDSNGAKVSEGQQVLACYQKILSMSENLSGVVPQVAVIAGSCVGVNAMMAASADISIMAEGASLYLVNDGGDTSAKAQAEAGVVSMVASDPMDAVRKAKEVLSVLPLNNLELAPISEGAAPAPAALDEKTASDELVKAVSDADSVIELGGAYAPHVYTALASVGGSTVGVVSVKGKLCNTCSGKAAAFVRFCDSFNLPVVTFVDTEGYKEGTCPAAAAKLAGVYAEATSAKVTVYTGNAIGAASMAFGSADIRLAWPTAVISALAPATAVEFFWHDRLKGVEDTAKARAALEAEYADTEASAFTAAASGMVDDVIAPADTRAALVMALDALASKRVQRLAKKHSC